MWEAIQSNRRRSVLLLWTLAAVLIGLGAAVGAAVHPEAVPLGIAGALVVWGVLYAVAALAGDRIVLSVAGAQKLEKADAPQLFNVVEEMVIASGLGRMPDIYLIPDDRPNAFAAGRRPETRVLAVTSGLLRVMNRDELQGVIAHEIGHHQNADVRFMILAGVMMGAIVLISEIFLRGMFHSRGGRSRRGGGDGGHAVLLIAALVFAILAPLAARMLYFACSRRREYLADASAARYTRYPEGLASALEKISGHYTSRQQTSRVLAPMYIVNPMEALAAVGLFSTHPPVPDRVRILRSMGGAGFKAYEEAFRKVHGGSVIGARTLAQDAPVAARGPSTDPAADKRAQAVQRSKEAHDLLARVAHLISLMCACGVTIRVPEGFKREAVDCPRCGRSNAVPKADAAPATAPAPDAPLRYQRQGVGWESFRCTCGAAVQLSPAFAASFIRCDACGRRIEVLGRTA